MICATILLEIAAYDTHIDLPGNTFSMWGAHGELVRIYQVNEL